MNTAIQDPRAFLRGLFDTAVAAVSPARCLAAQLPPAPRGRTLVIGAGKAAASMAQALEAAWQGPLSGMVVTRYGHGAPTRHIEVIEASHPVPDGVGREAAQRMLDSVKGLTADDLVICLISGGGSALLALPAPGVSLEEKQAINRALLKSGATITEMNCVRKHISAIKGGRLAAAAAPAQVVTLSISDVPGDDPSVIASGPTVPDPTTCADALAVLHKYEIDVPASVLGLLESGKSETPKPGDACFANTQVVTLATAQTALQAAAAAAQAAGIQPVVLGDTIEGESRDIALMHAALVRQIKQYGTPFKTPCVLISGGETTVTVRGKGRGGRDAEFLLALTHALDGMEGIHAIACDTDGIDGSEDNAGALAGPDTLARAATAGLDIRRYLANNDAYSYFEALGDLVVTGPTRTNVNDFRAILIT